MASPYTVQSALHATLATGGTAEVVNITWKGRSCMVSARGTVDVYFTVTEVSGGSAPVPTVGGADCYIATAGTTKTVVAEGHEIIQVGIIAATTATPYSVEVR